MNRVIRFVVVVLCLVIFCSLSGRGRAEMRGDSGSGVRGFTVTDTGTVNIIGAKTVTYTHDKTGARVMHIDNEDMERALRVTFETPALDNKGIPHVFEHICASGSQKYPSPNLFLAAMSQTYNTNMNATTYDAMTSYQYASMSEAQLLLIADYYMDSVFHPMLYTDELTFRRESWRYELASADAQLNYNGTVYNEMKGAITIERAAISNMLRTLYPESTAANNSGGFPADILTMTYEDCVNFHRAYYHPSNALIFLYGSLDIEPFLELIGRYCDEFGKKDVVIENGVIAHFSKPVTEVFEYPVEMSSKVEENSVIYYAFNLGRLPPSDLASFDMLSTVLAEEASPIVRKLRKALPNARTSVMFSPTTVGCVLAVSATGANERDSSTLKAAVDEAIAEILETGFDKEFLEAAIAAEEFYVMSMPERSGIGLRITSSMAWHGSLGYGYNNWNEYLDAIEFAKANYTTGYLEAMVGKFISGNPHSVLVTTVPAPGLKEKLDEQLRSQLDDIKAGMSSEDIARIIEANRTLAAMSEAETPAELLERLSAVTVETLPVEVKSYDIRERSQGGIKTYVTKSSTGGLNLTGIDFNSAAVTLEELHYLNLYAGLMGEVRTKSYDLTALKTKMSRYLYRFGASVGSRELYDYSFKPIFNIQWFAINGDYAEAVELVREMLIDTDVSDVDTIMGVIGRLKSSNRKTINDSPQSIMYSRAIAARFDRYAYSAYINGIDYYRFLSEAQKLLEDDPEGFIKKLRKVRDMIKFEDGVVVMFAGNAEGIETFEKNAGVLLGHLTEGVAPVANLSSLQKPQDTEGMVIDASVQYNLAFAAYGDIGLRYSGKLLPIAEILADAYLTPTVRYTIGAYSCWSLADRHGLVFVSYRDPSVTETFAAYDGAANFAASHGLTQDDVNRYIIRIFSQHTIPEGELNGAMNAMFNKYQGYPDDYKLNILREIKSVTSEDLTALSKHLTLAMERGVRSTAGGESVILENAELYKSIIYPFDEQKK
ncbi:MAG: insulinase family protein [Synergistaceae bacterium]|nr:insulinase family protein [Synergistaceae bacterium]